MYLEGFKGGTCDEHTRDKEEGGHSDAATPSQELCVDIWHLGLIKVDTPHYVAKHDVRDGNTFEVIDPRQAVARSGREIYVRCSR